MEQVVLQNSLYKKRILDNTDIITFFTPTFNRCQLLERVYSALINQTRKDFVWILVNDGSIDNTESIAKTLLEKEELPMLFVSKPNGGKHSAFKAAFELTETKFFMCLDDDDLYSEQSVEILLEEWQRIEEEKKNEIGAIRTLTFDDDNKCIMSDPIVDDTMMGKRFDVSSLDRVYKDKVVQENWTCYLTEALKQINLFGPYWLCEQHKFFSEGIWQARFARKFKCRYYYVVLRTYRRDTTTSLSRAVKSRQHYLDMFINTKLSLDEKWDYLRLNKRNLFEAIMIVSVLRHKLKISFHELQMHTENRLLKTAFLLLYPLNYIIKKPKVPLK